jgi:hypothetical protein
MNLPLPEYHIIASPDNFLVPLEEDVDQELHTPETQTAGQGLCSSHDTSATVSKISNPARFAYSLTPTNPWPNYPTEQYQPFDETIAPQLPISMALPEEGYQNTSFQTAATSPQPTDSARTSNLPDENDSLVEPEETMEAQQHYSWSD